MSADDRIKRLFACYSRQDVRIVAPIVELLRVTGAHVFRDEDSIPKGAKWRLIIDENLEAAELIVVFWSRHAAASDEVRKEFTFAHDTGKDILPVQISTEPMPPPLSAYQGITLAFAETTSLGFGSQHTDPRARACLDIFKHVYGIPESDSESKTLIERAIMSAWVLGASSNE